MFHFSGVQAAGTWVWRFVSEIRITPSDDFPRWELVIQDLLMMALQMLLFGGVGGVFVVKYGTNDLFVKEEVPQADGPRFASDYHELMWLAERQKRHPNTEETQRFFQLRHNWSNMHATGNLGAALAT